MPTNQIDGYIRPALSRKICHQRSGRIDNRQPIASQFMDAVNKVMMFIGIGMIDGIKPGNINIAADRIKESIDGAIKRINQPEVGNLLICGNLESSVFVTFNL